MPPRSSSLFIFSGTTTSVGAQRPMSQLSLFDVSFERNVDCAPARLRRPEPARVHQTDLRSFLGLPPAPGPVMRAPASPVPSDASDP